jgi:hypothetical protein
MGLTKILGESTQFHREIKTDDSRKNSASQIGLQGFIWGSLCVRSFILEVDRKMAYSFKAI